MEENATTFEHNGIAYEIVYAAKRIDMLEAALGNKSVLSVFGGAPSLMEMRMLAGYGLREQGSAAWMNPSKAMNICGEYIEENGFTSLMDIAATAMMRDCGFLFR
ncbi:MAG: hypothetical protein KIC37_07630 [Coriobacteriaceae bacterium]|nr:hypothetical protein [Coriobacteriaceae bacterium]